MKKVKTRDRILDTSLQLFNSLGEPNVTTLLISDELEISPGNLYYHFKSKGDIVEELFDGFEAEMLDLLAVPEDVEISLDQFGFFLHMLFEAVARYRFMYQDLVNVLSRYSQLQVRFRRILKKKTRDSPKGPIRRQVRQKSVTFNGEESAVPPVTTSSPKEKQTKIEST